MTVVVRYAHHLDLMLNEIREVRVQPLASLPAPSAGRIGQVAYDLATQRLVVCTGTAWVLHAGSSFEHVQAVPQAVVTVTHGLGYRPAVSAFALDYATQFSEYATQHLDANTVRVAMDAPRACVLVMS